MPYTNPAPKPAKPNPQDPAAKGGNKPQEPAKPLFSDWAMI
ncbi:hypothetical protein [Shimia sp. SDUM112013]